MLRARSIALTGTLETSLMQSRYFVPLHAVAERYPPGGNGTVPLSGKPGFTILTPSDPESRGAQLSLLLLPSGTDVMRKVFTELFSYGVIGDKREPDVIRLAPIPLYNSLGDCERAAMCLEKAFGSLVHGHNSIG